MDTQYEIDKSIVPEKDTTSSKHLVIINFKLIGIEISKKSSKRKLLLSSDEQTISINKTPNIIPNAQVTSSPAFASAIASNTPDSANYYMVSDLHHALKSLSWRIKVLLLEKTEIKYFGDQAKGFKDLSLWTKPVQ